MPDVFFVRPEGDDVECALAAWADLVIAACSCAGNIRLSDIHGWAVTRNAVEGAIGSHDATFYFGHGHDDRLGTPAALVDSQNVATAANTILIAVACRAGAKLGYDAYRSGVQAFLGFDDIVAVYLAQPHLFGSIAQDAITPFILSGSTVQDVRDGLIKGFKYIEGHYRANSFNPDADIIWMAAHINWRGITLVGNPDATIS